MQFQKGILILATKSRTARALVLKVTSSMVFQPQRNLRAQGFGKLNWRFNSQICRGPGPLAGDAAWRAEPVQSTRCAKEHRQSILDQSRIVDEEILATTRASARKRAHEDLTNKRMALFKSHEKSPLDLRLAPEIRIIYNQIAGCIHQMEQESRKVELVEGNCLC